MNREHFFSVCAHLMRQVLVDHARRRAALKRSPGKLRVQLDEGRIASRDTPRALLTSGSPVAVAEGCAGLHRVRSFWSGRRDENALPPNEAEELDRLAGWLARCPSAL